MQRTSIATASLLAALLLAGCYPEVPEYIDEYDLVFTDYSPSYDFKARTTYSLPDSVIKITGNLAEGEAPETVSPVYAAPILSSIRDNMNAYGWTEVTALEDPDVLVLPAVISSTTVIVSYPPYWGWYYPWGGGWYYPGYYPPSISSFSTGSLLVQMVDPNDPSATDNLPVPWIAVVNGLMEGSTSGVVTRINNSVDQAFEQSAYLKQ